MKFDSNFIVIDTEGKPVLQEIAIVDHQGNLVYEAFADDPTQNSPSHPHTKPLKIILQEFLELAQSKTIICHYARHDIDVLRTTFQSVGIPRPSLNFECSFKLAQVYLPELDSHSLESLSHHLNLKFNGKGFKADSAHRAKYDALFTYQLYRHMMTEFLKNRLKKQPNPFGSSRVDTPFQEHVDYREIFQSEFERLKSNLIDIKNDPNHQSKGAIVIGEPGSGKTHLIMRLAKDLLKTNRLLFIRQPNNPDAIIFHIYSRILESLIQTVPESNQTQLEYLLANSFAKIIRETETYSTPKILKDDRILEVIAKNNLCLFTDLSQGETKTKREYWQHIEKRAVDWWVRNFSAAGYAPQILKGIIRFCGYTDFNRRQIITQWLALNDLPQEELDKVNLESWGEASNREEISLAALEVFSKLSLLDEPLIIVFDQLEGLGLAHNQTLLRGFGEAIKEIFTHVPNSLIILNLFPDRWEQFRQIFDGSIIDRISQTQIFLEKPSQQKLQNLLKTKAEAAGVSLVELFETDELHTILNQASIRASLNTAADYYRYKINEIALPQKQFNTTVYQPTVHQPTVNMDVEYRIQSLTEEVTQLKQVIVQITEALNLTDLENGIAVDSALVAQSNGIVSATQQRIQDYLEQQYTQLAEKYSKPQIITESDDLGKLQTILESLKVVIAPLELDRLHLGRRVLPEHLLIKTGIHQFVVAFLHQGGSYFYHRIKNFHELIVDHRDIQFNLCREAQKGFVSGKRSLELLEMVRNAENGEFMFMEKEERIIFELIYQMIIDVQNYDLEVTLTEALDAILFEYKDYWLLQKLTVLTL